MQRWRGWIALAMLLVAGMPYLAAAENLGPGGGTRVITGDELVGPYRLFITASPEPAQVGQITFVVRITDPQSGDKIKDAVVHVGLKLPDGGTGFDQVASHQDAGNPIDYAAHIGIDQPGQYEGIVRIQAANGLAEVKFTQRVLAPRATSTLFILALPFAAALIVLGGFWYLRIGRRGGAL